MGKGVREYTMHPAQKQRKPRDSSPAFTGTIAGMTPLLILLAVISVAGVAAILWKLSQMQTGPAGTDAERERLQGEKEQLMQDYALLKANLEKQSEMVGELKSELQKERADNNEKQGKSKQLFAQYAKLEAQIEQITKERDQLRKEMARHEEAAERRQKEADDRLAKLEAAKVSLDQERQRVIREDEEKMRRLEEERDRIWNDHETSVVATMTDLCKQPAFAFTSYSNTNLPDGFDGSLKPDFMIEFLGQYVIFDAKVSKAKGLATYMRDQVKKTVEKVKNNDRIYKSIYLVVPTSALCELSQHHHMVDGYDIYIVSVEAVPALLAAFKRITRYEFAEQMDPEQRENIIQLIADFDFHINLRNAADIILTKMGTDILERAQRTDPELAAEVAVKKMPMNAKASIAASELKKIVSKLTTQVEEVQQLVSPHAPVRKKDLQAAETVIVETLF
jgi:hypothetical protein